MNECVHMTSHDTTYELSQGEVCRSKKETCLERGDHETISLRFVEREGPESGDRSFKRLETNPRERDTVPDF